MWPSLKPGLTSINLRNTVSPCSLCHISRPFKSITHTPLKFPFNPRDIWAFLSHFSSNTEPNSHTLKDYSVDSAHGPIHMEEQHWAKPLVPPRKPTAVQQSCIYEVSCGETGSTSDMAIMGKCRSHPEEGVNEAASTAKQKHKLETGHNAAILTLRGRNTNSQTQFHAALLRKILTSTVCLSLSLIWCHPPSSPR